MRTRRLLVILALATGGFFALVGQGLTETKMPKMRSTTQKQRKAAAANKKKAGLTVLGAPAAALLAVPGPVPGGEPDYFGPYSNWGLSPLPEGPVTGVTLTSQGSGYCTTATASITDLFGVGQGATATIAVDPFTGAITSITLGTPGTAYAYPQVSFVDCVPGTGKGAAATATIAGAASYAGGVKKFNQPLTFPPAAVADTTSFPGSDYYEIELVEYSWSFHPDLGTTKLRGYRQANMGGFPPSYLGPVIVAQKGRPTRIKFTNKLPVTSLGGDLFVPTDTSVMGAGTGYDPASGTTGTYSQNRGTLHLHGGFTPWISDGTPHQWVTPASEPGPLKTGVSTQPVPDMVLPSGDSITFYWPNEQSGRLMFYHDHAYGITRLNVYAGEAAGYLLTDPTERALNTAAGVPAANEIPLVIQDKTFVWGTSNPPSGTWATDPTWNWNAGATGSLWFPHVYMPNQNPWDVTGANAMGRWDYALWFWPPFTGLLANGTLANPYFGAAMPWEPPEIPGTPPGTNLSPTPSNASLVPEAFMDTPIINGVAYPTFTVTDATKPYRFRILNACNDRFLNLSLFVADSTVVPTTGVTNTEVKMVPFNSSQNAITPFPLWWYDPSVPNPFDDRVGGVPDPATRGPAMIQIGTEGGVLPAPAVIVNQPINYVMNKRDITVGNVAQKALFLGPAERADVIVDFSKFAGKTLILYNDSPAPVPAADPRIDYFTGDLDQTDTGGAPSTLPGYGPNTRTIMQIVVNGVGGTAPVDDVNATILSALNSTLPAAFASTQDPVLVPQAAYSAAYPSLSALVDQPGSNLSQIQSTSLTFAPLNSTTKLTLPLESKAIQELFELDYGRMNATLGVEIKFTNGANQTTIPYGYIDPATEIIDASATVAPVSAGDGTQLWKITHNGVDTHAIHVHLFNAQVINRVGWDGAIRPPDPNELGWKETIRMNPLEDIVIALRPTTPPLPFGVPDSIRLLDVTSPPGTTGQFTGIDPNNNPITVTNQLYNFGWEYVWHCHLLGHEENDMMRPTVFNAPRLLPPAPTGVTYSRPGGTTTGPVNLGWIDPTPPASSLGNPANEIGFKIERAVVKNGKPGAYAVLPASPTQPWPLANQTTYTDGTAVTGTAYSYRIVAYNAAGSVSSAAVPAAPSGATPNAPSGAAATLVSGPQVNVIWVDNSTNETSFVVERQIGTGPFSTVGTVGTNVTTFTDTTVTAGNTYTYRVKAANASGSSAYSTSGPVPVLVPAAPTGLVADPVQVGKRTDAVTIRWVDNATTETGYTVARCTGTAATCGLVNAVWTNVATLAANSVSYNNTSLTKGTTYSFRVAAFNLAGSSAWSNVIAVPMP